MIKTDIVAYVSSYALDGELIVPSAVLTSTPQEEEINLTYTPNFQLKLMDKNSYVVDDAWMSFSYADTNYTAYMNVVNRTQDGIVTLQYNNGLVVEKTPQPEPEPEPVDPLDSVLNIAGPLTQDPEDSSYSIVYSYETQDVYIKSKGMTYDSDNNRYEFVPDDEFDVVSFFAPTTHVFETITFVNLDSTYKSALLQTGELGYGVLTEDGNDLIWTRTTDYDPTDGGWINFVFEQIIQQVGAPMSFEEIRITLTPYVVPTEPPYFTSPIDGDQINTTIDAGTSEYTHPIELEYGDGTPIPYDITSQHVTCDNPDVTIEPMEDVDENNQTYISAVYMHIQPGTGTATLTYEDPDTGDTCTATFDYDIREGAHEA